MTIRMTMTFSEWYEFRGFRTLQEAADALDLTPSTVSRMRRSGYRADKFTVEHIRRKTGGKVILELTERNATRQDTRAVSRA